MIVCICNNVSEDEIICAKQGIECIDELKEKINICNRCCKCKIVIEQLLQKQQQE